MVGRESNKDWRESGQGLARFRARTQGRESRITARSAERRRKRETAGEREKQLGLSASAKPRRVNWREHERSERLGRGGLRAEV
jgi:hypothetical protein